MEVFSAKRGAPVASPANILDLLSPSRNAQPYRAAFRPFWSFNLGEMRLGARLCIDSQAMGAMDGLIRPTSAKLGAMCPCAVVGTHHPRRCLGVTDFR
jgi:hypothetical protein